MSDNRSRVTSAQTRRTILVRVGSSALLAFLDRCAKSTVGKVFLNSDHVGSSFELFRNRRSNARDPNLQFGIRIE
jgi:hypothetical protein